MSCNFTSHKDLVLSYLNLTTIGSHTISPLKSWIYSAGWIYNKTFNICTEEIIDNFQTGEVQGIQQFVVLASFSD